MLGNFQRWCGPQAPRASRGTYTFSPPYPDLECNDVCATGEKVCATDADARVAGALRSARRRRVA